MVFIGWLVASLLLVGVEASVSYAPENCLEVTVEACGGTDYEGIVSGTYVPYDGDCGEHRGAPGFLPCQTE